MIKSIIYTLLKPIDRLLQIIVPVHAARVCYISVPEYSDNAYYVYRHALQTRKSLQHVWLLKDMSVARRIHHEFRELCQNTGDRDNSLIVANKRSLKGYFLYLSSRVVFHTHGAVPFSSWTHKRENVNLWHGMPIKCIASLNKRSPNPYPTYGSVNVATSHMFKYIIACAFNANPETVKVLSLPRCDALQYETACATSKEKIKELLSVPENKKLVLWMPTYRTDRIEDAREKSDIRTFLDDIPDSQMEALDRSAGRHNCLIYVKLHIKDPLNHMSYPHTYKNIRMLTSQEWLSKNIQLYDLIAASDALISDISSILIDYLVTNNPIGLLGFNMSTYSRDLVFPAELISYSERYQELGDADSVANFMALVAENESPMESTNDLARMLYEKFEQPGSESILKEVSL